MPISSRGEINSIGINPGQFRHHITILEPVYGTDATGVVVSYAPSTPPVTAWAKIEGLRAEDQIKSGQDISKVQLRITVRYNKCFTPAKRIQKWNGNQYVINGVENVLEMDAYMILTCEGIGLSS